MVQGLQGGGMGGVPGMSGMSYVPSIFVHLVNDDYAGKLVVIIRRQICPINIPLYQLSYISECEFGY